MTALGESVFLQALGWAVLNSLWQMALLWVIFQLITGTFKGIKPGQKTSLASFMLMAGFVWFLYTFFTVIFNATHSTILIDSGFTASIVNENVVTWFKQTLPIAAFVYMFLLIVPIVQFNRNYRYVKTIRQQGLSKIHIDWRIFTKKMAAIIGIKKNVRVLLSNFVSSPVTIGFFKPIILIPVAAVNHLSTQQMEAVLLHELAHIRRHDFLLNIIMNAIQTLLYFNPFVKLFVKTIEREREKSCDEMVVQFQYDRKGYATALLLLEKANHISKPLVMSASGNKNDLLHRIEMILGIKKKPVFSFNKLAGLFAGLLFVIGLNAVLLLNKPENGSKPAITFSNISSPFYSFIKDFDVPAMEKRSHENEFEKFAQTQPENFKPSHSHDKINEEKIALQTPPENEYFITQETPVPVFVNLTQPSIVVPPLKQYQELQVKKAIEASKTIIEEAQWKAVEKNIADAMTRIEKEEVKSVYHHLMEKTDWKKWENNLKMAYNKIDWDRINEELGTALSKIKLDSLQSAYLIAAENINALQDYLKLNEQTCIPDSDITLEKLEQNQQQVQKALNTIKGMKTRKIIHL